MNSPDSTDDAFREGEPPLSARLPRDPIPDSNPYHGPLLTALSLTVLLLGLAACTMDYGETLRLSALAVVIFWGWVFYVRWRRPAFPTKWDLVLIEFGIIPMVVGFVMATHFVWHLRGLR